MIVHVLGAMLLILSGGLFAKSKTSAMKAHLEMLSALLSALEVMACEIKVRLTPVGEMIEALAKSDHNYSGSFFARVNGLLQTHGAPYLSRCWQTAVDECCQCLTQQERASLAELGSILGRYDVAEECAAIERCGQELKSGYDALRARYSTDTRLYTGLGLAAGCILAIVFL